MPPAFVNNHKKWEASAKALIEKSAIPCPVCGSIPKPAMIGGRATRQYRVGCDNKSCKGYGFMYVKGNRFEDVLAEWNSKACGDGVRLVINGKELFIKNCRDCPFSKRSEVHNGIEWECMYIWKPLDHKIHMPFGSGVSEECPMRNKIREIYDRELIYDA